MDDDESIHQENKLQTNRECKPSLVADLGIIDVGTFTYVGLQLLIIFMTDYFLNSLICVQNQKAKPNAIPELQHIQLTMMKGEELQQIFTFEEVETGNILLKRLVDYQTVDNSFVLVH